MKRLIAVLLGLSWSLAQGDPVGSYINSSLRAWDAPGVAVAVVKGGEVALLSGYGVRGAEDPRPVDPDTLFAAASLTKAFTATAAQKLAQVGRLNLDSPITQMVPGLKFATPELNQKLTLRQVLAHQSGLPGHADDALWWLFDYPPAEMLARLAYLKPREPLGQSWNYSNALYVAAGQAIAGAAGQSYAQVMAQMLAELGMNNSGMGTAFLEGKENVARPHFRSGGQTIPTRLNPNYDSILAAGGLITSARDLVPWLKFQLGYSNWLSPQHLAETHTMQVRTGKVQGYGLGWFVDQHRNQPYIWHNGLADGMTSYIGILPQSDLAVAVLANFEASNFPVGIGRYLLDYYSGQKPGDWSATYLQSFRQQERARTQARSKRKIGTPTLPLEQYLGSYNDPFLGTIKVELENGRLVVRAGPETGDLVPLGGHRFFLTFRDPAIGDWDVLTFETASPEVVALKLGEGPYADRMVRVKE